MEFAIDNKSELEKITDDGFSHIANRLGYEGDGLIAWTTKGGELSYQMGVLVRKGIQGDEMIEQEAQLLRRARELIEDNRRKYASGTFEMDSGP
ncbi:MAG: hypothetical protein AAB557_05755 [Patescibacteria group bacterium]